MPISYYSTKKSVCIYFLIFIVEAGFSLPFRAKNEQKPPASPFFRFLTLSTTLFVSSACAEGKILQMQQSKGLCKMLAQPFKIRKIQISRRSISAVPSLPPALAAVYGSVDLLSWKEPALPQFAQIAVNISRFALFAFLRLSRQALHLLGLILESFFGIKFLLTCGKR